MKRLALCLALLGAPAAAWEFTPSPICTISNDTGEIAVTVTYDPAVALYEIRLTLNSAPWAAAPVFAIRFEGPMGLIISTDRHQLLDGGRTLSVTDTGFGNVLNGLGQNRTAVAELGGQSVSVPLDGAAAPVEDFRACTLGVNA